METELSTHEVAAAAKRNVMLVGLNNLSTPTLEWLLSIAESCPARVH